MSTIETLQANGEGHDTSAVTEVDALGRPPREPPKPASVKINVEGAFIVDEETCDKDGGGSEFVHREHKDIRLPHHIDVVSHVALDVRYLRTICTHTNH